MKQSNVLWPEGTVSSMYGDSITTDTHTTEEQAQAVCSMLLCEGLGGERKVFPLMVWVSDVQNPPRLPYDDV